MSERNRRERINLNMKEIRKKVRRQGFMDTKVEENKVQKKDKYPHHIYDTLDEDFDDYTEE